MIRQTSEVRLGDRHVRYRTRLEFAVGADAHMSLINFMRTIADSPDLMLCGLFPPEKFTVSKSGDVWILDAEATVSATVAVL